MDAIIGVFQFIQGLGVSVVMPIVILLLVVPSEQVLGRVFEQG